MLLFSRCVDFLKACFTEPFPSPRALCFASGCRDKLFHDFLTSSAHRADNVKFPRNDITDHEKLESLRKFRSATSERTEPMDSDPKTRPNKRVIEILPPAPPSFDTILKHSESESFPARNDGGPSSGQPTIKLQTE